MRRFLFWVLLVSGLLMIILAIAEAHVEPGEMPVAHIVMSVIFIVTTIVHLVINRKAVMKYMRGK